MTTTINNEHKKLNVPNSTDKGNVIRNVPHLRFPEFEGEWEKQKLCDISSIVGRIGFRGYTTNDIVEKGMGAIALSPTNIVNNQLTYDKENTYISMSKYEESPEIMIKRGDVIFVKTGSTVGKVAYVDKMICKTTLNPQVVVLKDIKCDNYILSVIMSTRKFQNKIQRITVGGAVPTLSQMAMGNIFISLPAAKEQEKISKFISLLDERIATQSKIIEDLKKLKSAIIEKHYCKVEKQIACVGDLGEPFSVGNLAKDDLTETGIPCVIYGELFTTYGETISQIESHTYKTEGIILSKKGDLLFPSSTTVDAMSLIAPSVINMDGVILGGDMFGIHISPNFNAQYLSYYFNHIAKRQLAKFAKGSTIIHLHYADIEKAKLLLPSLEEQNRMAKCLVTLDDKIKKERTFFDLLNSQKAYLLCHMFI